MGLSKGLIGMTGRGKHPAKLKKKVLLVIGIWRWMI